MALINDYPDVYEKKRLNPRFENDSGFIAQVAAEIGRTKDLVRKRDNHVSWQDKPRPRKYVYNADIEQELQTNLATAGNSWQQLATAGNKL